MLFLQRHIQKALAGFTGLQSKIVISAQRYFLFRKKSRIEESTLLKNLLTSSPDIIFFKDTKGYYLGGNKPHADLVGVPEDEIIGKSDFDLHPDNEHLTYIAETDQSVIKTGETYQNTGQPIEYLGETRYFDIIKMPIRSDDGETIGLMGVARDITRIHEAEQRVLRKNRFLHELANISVSYTNNSNIDRRFNTVIDCAAKMIEADSGSIYLASSPVQDLTGVSTPHREAVSSGNYARKVAPQVWAQESMIVEDLRIRDHQRDNDSSPESYAVAVPLFTDDKICGVLAFEQLAKNPNQYPELSEEITFLAKQLSMVLEQQKMVTTIEYQANYDALTNIPNRKMFEESFYSLMSEAIENDGTFALINMDLDGFKSVNDTYGHHKGDELLRQVASRLQANVRPGDLFARMGGDEFALIGRNVDSHMKANQLANQILFSFQSPFQLDDVVNVNVGTSIGYALFPSDASDAMELMIAADSHMYQSKHSGGQPMSGSG